MKKICRNPFEEHPFSSCYSFIAFPCSVIQAKAGEQREKWLCGKYINCSFNPSSKEHKFILSIADGWSSAKSIMVYQAFNFSKEMVKTLKIDIIRTVKKAILYGCYPHGPCSERVLFPEREVSSDSLYSYILSGFDDVRKIFFTHGFSGGEYQHFEVPYETYIKALFENPKRNITIHLWRYNPNADYTLDLKEITNDLNDYIASKNSKPQYEGPRTFGLRACSDFGTFVAQETANGNRIDPLCMKSFWEHKYCMAARIRYFCKEGIIKNDALLPAEQVLSLAERILLLDRNNELNQIPKLIAETVSIEQNYLPAVMEELRDFQSDLADQGKNI